MCIIGVLLLRFYSLIKSEAACGTYLSPHSRQAALHLLRVLYIRNDQDISVGPQVFNGHKGHGVRIRPSHAAGLAFFYVFPHFQPSDR